LSDNTECLIVTVAAYQPIYVQLVWSGFRSSQSTETFPCLYYPLGLVCNSFVLMPLHLTLYSKKFKQTHLNFLFCYLNSFIEVQPTLLALLKKTHHRYNSHAVTAESNPVQISSVHVRVSITLYV